MGLFNSFLLLAQGNAPANAEDNGLGFSTFLIIGIVVAVATVLYSVGNYLARSLRMSDHGWKIGLMLITIIGGIVVTTQGWPPKLGIDLSGGVILVYEISDEEEDVDMAALIQALGRRINPSGVKEIVVRQYGDRQVEIIIPEIEASEIDYLKKLITKAGVLKFRIVADRSVDDPRLFEIAQAQNEDALKKGLSPSRQVFEGKQLKGEWVDLGLDHDASTEGAPVYKVDVSDQENMTRELHPGKREVLMLVTRFNVEGKDLKTAASGYDDVGRPAVNFSMTAAGAAKMGGLTNLYVKRRLGIVMDNELLSAPVINSTITSNGIIEGRFTQEEIDLLVGVLKAGKLPTALKRDPISDNEVSAILGSDTVQKGRFAIAISFCAVLIFMTAYYRFPGLVACTALAINLLLLLAIMILFKAAFTLPGLAGLVLTVGMSVDANVLIFERIREELNRGSALRMAIRNGFGRATRTIVDANITTLITAIVLYAIGTEQIRGFAVILILGILMSMYSAIFCSRVVFDIAERKRWVSTLNMTRIFGKTQLDFIGKRQIAAVVSFILIVVGLSGAVYRGKNLLDIDFNGGTSVEIMLQEPIPIGEVRNLLAERLGEYDPSVFEVQIESRPPHTVYKIDTAITGEIDDTVLKNRGNIVGADLSGLALVEAELRSALSGNMSQVDFTNRNDDTGQITVRLTLTTAASLDEVEEAIAERLTAFDPIVSVRDESSSASILSIDVKLFVSGVQILQDQLMKLFPGQLVRHSVTFSPVSQADKPLETSLPSSSDATADDVSPVTDESVLDEFPDNIVSEKTDNSEQPESAEQPVVEQHPELPTEDKETDVSTDLAPASDPQSTPVQPPQPAEEASDNSGAGHTLPPSTWLAFAGSFLSQADEGQEVSSQPSDAGTANLSSVGISDTVSAVRTDSTLHFAEAVNRRTLIRWLTDAAERVGLSSVTVEGARSGEDEKNWVVELAADERQANSILGNLKSTIDETPVWLSSNKIGGKVAGDTRNKAIAALITSLIGIVLYIWLRFERISFGLAAVIALVHDVLITLGALALSFWLAQSLGFLLVTEFKINLPIVAAFLTIIGYSLNDTIVVFDRIREVRGKSPVISGEMVNTSINQTLSRTVLTSFTTMLVVGILYVAGGESIHGFAFSLVIGILVGTYSSIFVASPALLWMNQVRTPTAKPRKPVSVG